MKLIFMSFQVPTVQEIDGLFTEPILEMNALEIQGPSVKLSLTGEWIGSISKREPVPNPITSG